MQIRCKSCHAVIWFQTGTEPTHCSCGRVYRLGKPIGAKRLERLGRQARERAQQLDIDLPAAYSIVLGILTPEQIRDVSRRPTPARADENPEEPRKSRRPIGFDRGFEKAVADGCLAPLEALERGNREALAARIAGRHGLSKRRAYDVADNRVTLLAALRDQNGSLQPTVVPDLHSTNPWSAWRKRGLAAAGLAFLALGVWSWQTTRTPRGPSPETVKAMLGSTSREPSVEAKPATREQVLRSATEVDRDRQGRIVRVVGPDPRSVTIAFCEASGPQRRWEAVDVSPSSPPEVRSRLGVIRDLDSGSFHTLAVRQDRATRRWALGDGLNPVRVRVATEAALNAVLAR